MSSIRPDGRAPSGHRTDADALTRGVSVAVEHVPDPVFVASEGFVCPANPAAQEILGPAFAGQERIAVAAMLDRIDLRDPATGERTRPEQTAMARALAGERASQEGLVRDPNDGRMRKIVITGSPVERPGQAPAAVLVLRDVTDQWHAEQALQREHDKVALLGAVARAANCAPASEDVLREALEDVSRWAGWPVGHVYLMRGDVLVPGGIWCTHHAGDLARFVECTARTPMKPGEGFVGRVAVERRPIWHDDVSRDPGFVRRGAAGRLRSGFAAPVLVGDEVVAVLEFYAEQVIEPDEETLAVIEQVGIQLGRVMERERNAAALAQARDQCFRMLEDFPALLGRTDPSGAMSWVNGTWLAFSGRTLREEVGEGWLQPVHPDDRSRCRAIFRRAVEERAPYEMEYRTSAAGGRYRSVVAVGRPFEAGEGFAGLLCGAFDVSEHRRLEEELRQAQRMEAVGRLAGGVAHDFNNVLTVLLSHTQLALDEVPEGSPLREDLEEMLAASRRGVGITRQLLALSRTQPIEPVVLDPGEVVRAMAPMLRRLVEESVALEVDIASDTPRVLMDRTHLEQVLMNLATNARDAMPGGGTLLIGTSSSTPTEEERQHHADLSAGTWTILRVSDTGEGMTEAVRQRIFEPFFTTRPAGGGTGLGLSTVYGIVKQAGGAIDVWSRPGAGTTFEIVFPASPGDVREEPHSAPSSVRPKAAPATILVVEDQAAVRAVVRRVLEREGYDVLTARHGGEALLICEERSSPVELVVTDIVMPEMSGWQLIEHVALVWPDVRCLLMTGYSEDLLDEEMIRRAAGRLLHKPLTPEVLLEAVRRELGRCGGEAAP